MGRPDIARQAEAYVSLATRLRTFTVGQTDVLLGIGMLVGAALSVSAWSGERSHTDFFYGMAAMVLLICVPWAAFRWWMRRAIWNRMWEIDRWFQEQGLHIRDDGSTTLMAKR